VVLRAQGKPWCNADGFRAAFKGVVQRLLDTLFGLVGKGFHVTRFGTQPKRALPPNR
jgi:hypothetical protein